MSMLTRTNTKTDSDIQKHLSIEYERSLSAKGLEKLNKTKHLQHSEQRNRDRRATF